MTRRGLFGFIATLLPASMMGQSYKTLGIPTHVHDWDISPFNVNMSVAYSGPSEFTMPLEVCSVKGCGMIRVAGGESFAGKKMLSEQELIVGGSK